MERSELYRRVLPSIGPIIFRNIFLLVNAVIFGVVILLFVFGNPQSGLFLGIVALANTLVATIQDVHARLTLEKLQMLTALRVIRLGKNGSEEKVLAEKIVSGDSIKLSPGDQVPSDGVLVSGQNVEVSEALITGESDAFAKKNGDAISAGSMITAGSGIFKATNSYKDSRLARISENVKMYEAHPSSIQRETNRIIQYSGYILIAVILSVALRGFATHRPTLEIIMNIGALASMIVPQGLLVVTTLLFAIGAASYSKRDVLFQEINATEKLGRIKNLCMDKTGTLTNTAFEVEELHTFGGVSRESALGIMSLYIRGSGDASEIISSVERYSKKNAADESTFRILSGVSFSAARKYGGVVLEKSNEREVVLVGTPDIFLTHIADEASRTWMTNLQAEHARSGKRMLCAVRSNASSIPLSLSPGESFSCSVFAVFVFSNTFRTGINETISFFQNRGVRIRILSGDNVDTVLEVARRAGIYKYEKVITGSEMKSWTEIDYEKKSDEYSIFAQVVPEQKVRLVEAFKKNGFTAMVGDGINDALAMKKSDLGIAMFDGVPVTRQLAGVVLLKNSFADLPGAVRLADNFIKSLELSTGVYVNQSFAGLLLFIFLSFLGFSYPLAPLNITFMNYFTIGLPGILITYWALRPEKAALPATDRPFLSRVLPFVIWSSILESITATIIFAVSPEYLKLAQSNTLVMLAFVVSGFIFLLLAPLVYYGSFVRKEKLQLLFLILIEITLLLASLSILPLAHFFSITTPYPSLVAIEKTLLILAASGCVHFCFMKYFFLKKEKQQ